MGAYLLTSADTCSCTGCADSAQLLRGDRGKPGHARKLPTLYGKYGGSGANPGPARAQARQRTSRQPPSLGRNSTITGEPGKPASLQRTP